MTRIRQTLAAATILAVLVGAPWLMLATIGGPIPHPAPDLTGRMTLDALAGLLTPIAWAAWAWLAASLLTELVNVGGPSTAAAARDPPAAAGRGPRPHPAPGGSRPDRRGRGHRGPARSNRRRTPPRPLTATQVLTGHHPHDQAHRVVDRARAPVAAVAARQDVPAAAQVATLPAHPTHQTTAAAPDARPTVIVERPHAGEADCLWNIAETHLGDGERWREIYHLNRTIIDDPDLIYPGQVLVLPDDATGITPTPDTKPTRAPRAPARGGR